MEHVCIVWEGSGQAPGLASRRPPQEAGPRLIKREGKQRGRLFRCCPPKWGPGGGMDRVAQEIG